MAARSYFIIHNPTAARGKAAGTWQKIRPHFERSGVRFSVAAT
jgi:diacylglycerol kinase family enzyme